MIWLFDWNQKCAVRVPPLKKLHIDAVYEEFNKYWEVVKDFCTLSTTQRAVKSPLPVEHTSQVSFLYIYSRAAGCQLKSTTSRQQHCHCIPTEHINAHISHGQNTQKQENFPQAAGTQSCTYFWKSFISKQLTIPFLHIWNYTANKCFQAYVTISMKHSKKLNMVTTLLMILLPMVYSYIVFTQLASNRVTDLCAIWWYM